MMILLRRGFGLNTNLLETNILNLTVVFVLVVKVVGDSLRDVLDQRRKIILSILKEADQKASEAKKRLEEAEIAFMEARSRVQEICIQADQTVERESSASQKQLEKDLLSLQEKGHQAIELERQRTSRSISQKISNLALTLAENKLMKTFGSQNTPKQRELNEVQIRETFCQLKSFLSIF